MPMVTWQGPDGSRQTTPLEQAPPQIQTLYTQNYLQPQSQLQETNAAAGAAGASALASTEVAQRTAQEIALAKRQQEQQQFQSTTQQTFDKAKGKTGYVSPQTYNQQKEQAASLGIEADQFDRLYEHNYTDPTKMEYNTSTGFSNRNAYGEVKRQIQAQIEQFNSIPQDQKGVIQSNLKQLIPGLAQMLAPDAISYENSTSGLAGQLKGLIGGTGLRITQAELNNWQNLLPNPRNSDEQNNKNLQILDAQLKATFNAPVGLDQHYLPQGQAPTNTNAVAYNQQLRGDKSGANLLSTLITNAGKDIKGDVEGAAQTKQFGINSMNPADEGNIKSIPAMLQEYGHLLSNPKQHAIDHPVNTALDVLGPLLALKGGGVEGAGGSSGASLKDPGALQKVFTPNKIKAQAGAMRDATVHQASQTGAVIPGDNIVAQLQHWADTVGKPGNPGQHAKIDDILQQAQQSYSGKQINPVDAQRIYNEVDSGYNQKGVQKDAIQARGDIALRQILRGEIEKVAPGFDKLTNIIGQGYKAEQGAAAKIVKNLPQNAVRAGLNVAGLGVLRQFIGL